MTLQRAQKVLDRIEKIANISDRDDCLCREFGTPAGSLVRQLITRWMQEAELKIKVDNILNIRGLYDCKRNKTFLMGSHLDTVLNAGKYDGILGVLLALDQAERFYKHSVSLPFNFEVVGFSEEEGGRFRKPYLGSLALTGNFRAELLNLQDREGTTLAAVVQSYGKDPQAIEQDACTNMAGYLEVHIEQGPVLDKLKLPVGLVTGIAGQQRHQISFLGVAGHAGTVPLSQRKDALLGASELIVTVEKIALKYPSMVVTVGSLEVFPNVTNVIPEKVNLSLDIRHQNQKELNKAVDDMRKSAQKIAGRRQLVSFWEMITKTKPVICDQQLSELLKDAILKTGYPVKHIVSGAGHDAAILSKIGPVGMLFIRCDRGISHNPLEKASLEDIQCAISVCDHFFDNLTKSF